MSNFFLAALTTTPAATDQVNPVFAVGGQILMLAAIFLIFYFLMIRPQKKREKEVQKMRSNVQIGDEVVTVGGIIGIVVSIKDDTVVIETGTDRSKVRIARWAVQENKTIHDDEESSSK